MSAAPAVACLSDSQPALQPGSPAYQLLNTGSLPPAHAGLPLKHPVREFKCALPAPMRSAYVQATGAEP